jgi:hypothetical protein
MADDVKQHGPTLDLLAPTADEPFESYYPLRLLSAVHWLVLQGKARELDAHYPSVGGDGDADAAWPHIRQILAEHPIEIDVMLDGFLQTNEPSRSGALIVGFLEVAARTGLPLSVLEIGSSAGLNLQFDRFSYQARGQQAGDPTSAVRFVDYWLDGTPRFDAPLTVVERRGCDLRPVDLTDPDERTRLLAYVWPDMVERFATIRAGIEIAAAHPVTIDRAPIPEWVEAQLADAPTPGRATVVFHSIVWVYLDDEDRARVTATIERAGAKASKDAPIAWLRYEDTDSDSGGPALRLRMWPDGTDHLLGAGSFHHDPFTLARDRDTTAS